MKIKKRTGCSRLGVKQEVVPFRIGPFFFTVFEFVFFLLSFLWLQLFRSLVSVGIQGH